MRVIYCRECHALHVIKAGTLPASCLSCKISPGLWTTQNPAPAVSWALTARDKALLRALKIAPDA